MIKQTGLDSGDDGFGSSGRQMSIEIEIYNDPWMDNGLENFYRIVRDVDGCDAKLFPDKIVIDIHFIEKFTENLSKKIIEKRENLIVVEKDKKTELSKEVKKDYVLIQEEKKIGGKVALKEDIYKPEKVRDIISTIFSTRAGSKKCILCGRTFDKSIKKLQQASYPFVTKIGSLSGVRSYKDGRTLSLREYYDNVCPFCYLVGILGWTDDALVYRTFINHKKSLLFLPYFFDLKTLHKFKQMTLDSGMLDVNVRDSNIRVSKNATEIENTPGEYSTLLCFYEKFIENAADEIIANRWAVLHIPFGAVKNVKIDEIIISEGIIGIIREVYDTGKSINYIYSDLIKNVYFFSENKKDVDWNITHEIQEQLSKYFLLNDFRNFTSYMLPKKGGYVFFSSETRSGLEELIYVWRWKKMGVPKEKLEVIKSVGNIVAKVSKNNASLLYKMDKVRSVEEFWKVLREVSRKMPVMDENTLAMTKPTALDELIYLIKDLNENEKNAWEEIRDLIVIYASMYYSLEKMNKGGAKK